MFVKSNPVCRGSGNVVSCRESLSAVFAEVVRQGILDYGFWRLGYCKEPRFGLNQLSYETDRLRIPLQDENLSEDELHMIPGFLRLGSGCSAERFRNVSLHVSSIEIRLLWTEPPKCGTLSCWILGTVFYWPRLQTPGKFLFFIPRWFLEQMCVVTGRS